MLGIMMLLFGLTAPSVSRAWRQAEAIQCQSNLRQLGLALSVYANENRGVVYPSAAHWPPIGPTWGEMLFEEPAPPVLVCPTGRDQQTCTYQLNFWTWQGRIRMEGGNSAGLPASRIPLAGESPPGRPSEYTWVWLERGEVSWDRARHGPGLQSNYLWLDLHVDNGPLPPADPPRFDPWYVPTR